MNRVILIGRAAKDFELRYSPAGTAIATSTIAVDRQVAQGKEKEADFINLVAFKQLAETCANYIKRGHKFAIEGRIQVRNYENNEGRKVYVTEVIVDRVEFLEQKQQNGGNQSQDRNAPPPPDDSDDLPF